MALQPLDPSLLAYVGVFAAAALACFASAVRARTIDDPDTRRGLLWLLLLSGGWATTHVGFLVSPTPSTKVAFYVAGLTVGFAAVGAWLYFCSAYTGRSLHRNPTVRRLAVAVFAGATLLKLTNPVHGLYFATVPVASPFPHLAIQHGLAHWLLMGLAYALSIVGYFMLFELFTGVRADARPLIALATVTGLPILLDVVGFATTHLIDVSYEPIGVAAFAVGVLFVYVDRFEAVQLAGSSEEPVVLLTEDGRIRDVNDSARDLFPGLADRDAIGRHVDDVLPELRDVLDSEASVLEVDRDGETRYYRVTASPFSASRTSLGRLLAFDDVTERERYRRELERQNDRLERFASTLSHDLRNPINVAAGWVETVRSEDDDERLAKAADALDRMEELVDDMLALARTGQPIDETEPTSLATIAERSWRLVETDDAELVVEGDRLVQADPDRLGQLFDNLFRNSVEHSSTHRRAGPDDSVEHGSTGSRAEPDDSVEHSSTGSRTSSNDSVEHSSTGRRVEPEESVEHSPTGHRTGSDDSVEHSSTGRRVEPDDSVERVGGDSRSVPDEGGPAVTVRVGPTDDGFFVADDGTGIPPDQRERVFESGFTTAEDGTGFGLAIVAEVVEAHGWAITATESETGGARFEVAGVDGVDEPRDERSTGG